MTKAVWTHVLGLSAWTLKIAHIINYREAQTMPACIRYNNNNNNNSFISISMDRKLFINRIITIHDSDF